MQQLILVASILFALSMEGYTQKSNSLGRIIEDQLPPIAQEFGKDLGRYLVHCLHYVSSRTSDFKNTDILVRLTEEADRSYSSMTPVRLQPINYKMINRYSGIRFSDFIQTVKGGNQLKQVMYEISDAIYNNDNRSKIFLQKLSKVLSGIKAKKLDKQDQRFAYMLIGGLYYGTKALASYPIPSQDPYGSQSNAKSLAEWWYEVWYGESMPKPTTADVKCALGTLASGIAGGLGSAGTGPVGIGVGISAGVAIGVSSFCL